MFHAAKLFSQNERLFLTEPRRSPGRRRSPAPGGRLGSTRGLELSPCSVFPHESGRYPGGRTPVARGRQPSPRTSPSCTTRPGRRRASRRRWPRRAPRPASPTTRARPGNGRPGVLAGYRWIDRRRRRARRGSRAWVRADRSHPPPCSRARATRRGPWAPARRGAAWSSAPPPCPLAGQRGVEPCQATSGIDPPATPKTDPPKKRRMLLKWWVFR